MSERQHVDTTGSTPVPEKIISGATPNRNEGTQSHPVRNTMLSWSVGVLHALWPA